MGKKEEKYTRRRIRSYYVTSVFSISMVLFLLGLIGYLVLNTNKLSNYVKENFGFTVILKNDVNIESGDFLQFYSNLQRKDFVREIHLISKDSAVVIYKDMFEEDIYEVLDNNPFPHSIDVKLNADFVSPEKIESIKNELSASSNSKFVKSIRYDKDLLDKVNTNIMNISFYILVFSAILLFISFMLINNTIRLSVYSKRFIIKTMQLVGASKAFIRKPFLLQGLLQGVYGALLAIIMLSGVIYLMHRNFMEIISLEQYDIIGILFGLVLVLGVVISTFSTFFSVNKYINIKKDNLYF
ncbi:MAG: cell division protein FtsX [Bacteroidales bacterium]|nr:cell division protein FtsX [Bacteroidales bacterium]